MIAQAARLSTKVSACSIAVCVTDYGTHCRWWRL